jgi:C-terminal processing protease CtpA/Prc
MAAALRDMPGTWLLRSKNQQFTFKLVRDSRISSVKCKGVTLSSVDFYAQDWDTNGKDASYRLLTPDIGYVFPARYHVTELDSIKKKFKNTKGIIVDLRCYPSDDLVFSFGNYLKPDSSVFVKFAYGLVNHPGYFFKMTEKNGLPNAAYYKGKIVVIVNSKTQSNAEFVTMAFQSAPNTTVIGSETAGADGNIVEIPLPGGFTTWMSGLGVYYPDGTHTQGRGVKINLLIKPTIKGIKAGRDELLEKAEQLINTVKQGD